MNQRLGDAILELRTDDRGYAKGVKKAERSARKLDKTFDGTARNVERTSKRMAAAFKTAAAAIGVAVAVDIGRSVAKAGLDMERFERALKFATGSTEGAAAEWSFLRETALRLGLALQDVAGSYASLAASAKGTELAGQATRNIFLAIAEASTVLGLSGEQMSGALTAIEQIISKGTVSAEELRGQLGERLPGAFQIAARSLGVTTSRLDDMLRKGEVLAEDLLPKLATELRKTYGADVQAAVDGAQAAIGRFETAIFELKTAIAQSGVLDALAGMATGLANVIAPGLELQIQNAQQQVEALSGSLQHLIEQGSQSGDTLYDSIARKLADANAEMDELLLKQGRLLSPNVPASSARTPAGAIPLIDTSKFPQKRDEDLATEALRVAREIQSLEEQVLVSQRRMGEAIRLAADRQIAEWQRVAVETPTLAEQAARAIELINQRTAADMENLADDLMTPWEQFAQGIALTMEDNLTAALANIQSFGDAAKAILQQVAAEILRVGAVRPLLSLIPGFGGLFPGFATGGRPPTGRPYWVGEDGPELRVDDRPGTIIPNHRIGATAGGIAQEFNFGIAFPPQLEAMIRNVAGPAGREGAMQVLNARRGKF